MSEKLNRFSARITEPRSQGASQAMLYGTGLTEDDIDLTAHDTTLSMRVTYPAAEAGEDLIWHRRERVEGSFLRTIELPFRVDPEHVDARFENGVLAVEMQRPEADKPKHIKIKAT